MNAKVLMSAEQLQDRIEAMADVIQTMAGQPENVALIGIRTRGAVLAQRLHARLKARNGWDLPLGILDITLYRDDLSQLAPNPLVQKTWLDFDVNDRLIILVDDVLYTGRTVRSALAEILDFGRPRAIRLLVLVDRGGHELPIQADCAMLTLDVPEQEVVKVCLTETDAADQVLLGLRETHSSGMAGA